MTPVTAAVILGSTAVLLALVLSLPELARIIAADRAASRKHKKEMAAKEARQP